MILGFFLVPTFARAEPEAVYFRSADKRTEVVGYLFKPSGAGPHPAIVLLHGRVGLYSSNVNGDCTVVARNVSSECNQGTLSKRHAMWGQYWAEHGYLALLPDSFGPRGKAYGFGRGTHGSPEREDVHEKTVRPLDAEGALVYLSNRQDVVGNRIFLQGWSNGGSTALNVMIRQGEQAGFRGALVFYPGCGPDALVKPEAHIAAPIMMFLAGDDREVSPARCQEFVANSLAVGTPINFKLYPGASHNFDDPGSSRQSMDANRRAKADAMEKAAARIESIEN